MPIRIAVVDDEPKIRGAWRRVIERQPDMEFVTELSSADALVETMVGAPADVILLDMTMPGLDPLVAIEMLADQMAACRVLVYSAHRVPELVERSLAAGAWGFVDKLELIDDVLHAMRAIASGETAIPPWFAGPVQR